MTTMSTVPSLQDVQAIESRHVLQTYKRQPIEFVRGEGVRLFDSTGREYYDLLSGIGVAAQRCSRSRRRSASYWSQAFRYQPP